MQRKISKIEQYEHLNWHKYTRVAVCIWIRTAIWVITFRKMSVIIGEWGKREGVHTVATGNNSTYNKGSQSNTRSKTTASRSTSTARSTTESKIFAVVQTGVRFPYRRKKDKSTAGAGAGTEEWNPSVYLSGSLYIFLYQQLWLVWRCRQFLCEVYVWTVWCCGICASVIHLFDRGISAFKRCKKSSRKPRTLCRTVYCCSSIYLPAYGWCRSYDGEASVWIRGHRKRRAADLS